MSLHMVGSPLGAAGKAHWRYWGLIAGASGFWHARSGHALGPTLAAALAVTVALAVSTLPTITKGSW